MSLTIIDMTGDRYWPEVSKEIRENLINPFFDIDWKVHAIDIYARDKTNDGALQAAIADLKTHKAAVKGPTITPTVSQTKEYGLSQQFKSPNGIIRSAINGAVIMRSPIDVKNIPQFAENINNVTTARQAVGGIYGAPNFDVPEAGTLTMTLTNEKGETTILSEKPAKAGVAMVLTETNDAIRDFVTATLDQGLLLKKSVLFASKSTINPAYDGRFIDTFKTSDQLAGEARKLGMMDSTLISLDGTLLADPPHGTADDLEATWLEKGILLANPTAYIFAYAEAIRHKASIENQPDIADMAILLKNCVVETIENGKMTGDLARELDGVDGLNGQEFIAEVNKTFAFHLNNNPAFNQKSSKFIR